MGRKTYSVVKSTSSIIGACSGHTERVFMSAVKRVAQQRANKLHSENTDKYVIFWIEEDHGWPGEGR